MHIAIIGAGFAGVAIAWFLLQHQIKVTLFDSHGIGGGASGMAAGLLHPYSGEQCRRSWRAGSGIQATLSLIDIAETALGRTVVDRSGIVRLILNGEQKTVFEGHQRVFGDVEWWDEKKVRDRLPGIVAHSAVHLTQGFTVHCRDYLEGLWKACCQKGASLVLETIDDLSTLTAYDQVVLTTGAHLFKELVLPVKRIKGQIIQFVPSIPLQYSVIGKGYLARVPHTSEWVAGATYEKAYTTEAPCKMTALAEIAPKVVSFYPHFSESEVLSCKAAVRLGRKNHYLPFAGKLKENLWTLTALQSRGLLYHAHLAEILAQAIVSGDETLLPSEVRPCF